MTTIKLRRGTSAQWATADPVLAAGEPGYDTTTRLLGVGDGETAWSDLPKYLDETAVAASIAEATAAVFKPATLREFRARASASASAPCDILAMGCSQMEGTGAGSFGRRYVDLVFRELRRRYQPPGIPGGRGFFPAHYSQYAIPGPATPVGSVDANNTSFGLGGRSYYIAADNAGMRFNSSAPVGKLNGTSIDVCYLPLGNGGPLQVTEDGAAAATFSTTGSQAEFSKHRHTFATRGAHDIDVLHPSGANVVLTGVMEYDGDEEAGLRFWDASRFGASTDYYWSQVGSNGALQKQANVIQPALVLTDLHVNDYLNNIDPATTKTRYQQLINAINGGTTFDPSVALIHSWHPVHSGTPAYPWSDYLDVVRNVQAAYPSGQVDIIDLSTVLPDPTTDTTGLYLPDGIHATAKGHGLEAAHLAPLFV